MAFKMVVLLLVGLLFAVFVLENTDPATIQFLGWSEEVPLAMVMLGSLATGAIIVFLLSMIRELGLQSRLWEHRRDSRRMEQRIEELEEESTRHQEEAARLSNHVERLEEELEEAQALAEARLIVQPQPLSDSGDNPDEPPPGELSPGG